MKRKLLALLLCTVIIFNNALPVLADGIEGEQTGNICGDNCAEHPELTKCEVCGEVKCICNKDDGEDKTEPSENITEAPAVEICKICNTENCETEHTYCETCAKYDCGEDHSAPECTCGEAHDEANADCPQYVAPVTETCELCGKEKHEGECAPAQPECICGEAHDETNIDCPQYVAPEVENCEICGEAKHEDACQICLCGAVDADTHAENCMNIMMPKCEICEGAHTTDKCPENCQACHEVEGAEHTCGKIFCEICMEKMFEDIEHIHCTECEELLNEGLCPICSMVPLNIVDFTEVGPFLPPVEAPVRRPSASTWSGRSSLYLARTGETDGTQGTQGTQPARTDADGLETSKSVRNNGDGTYTITLENYVTGSTTISSEMIDVPTDIVLVLDQSSSMRQCIEHGADMTTSNDHINCEQRMVVLKDAAKAFADNVSKRAMGADQTYGTEDDINHRIAVVAFSSESNTGVFVNGQFKSRGNMGNGITEAHYTSAFEDMNTTAGLSDVKTSVNNLNMQNGTYSNRGMEVANAILNKNDGSGRYRIVIMFTDGAPGNAMQWGDPTSSNVANQAIGEANEIKENGVTVYTIGIFNGANASDPDKLPPYNNSYFNSNNNNENRYMHLVSSNYPDAVNINTPGSLNSKLEDGQSYYLSASNSTALNNIFTQIANEMQNGEAQIQLGTSTQVRDIVTPYFEIPETINNQPNTVKVYTAKYKSDGTWVARVDSNLEATVSGNTVSVSGFDYALYYCDTAKGRTEGDNDKTGDFYGKKLIIEFTIVPKEGFLGGNDVPTNGTESGVYANASAQTPLEQYEYQDTNVLIPKVDVEVSAADKNVYYNGSIDYSTLMKDSTAYALITTKTGVQKIDLNLKDSSNPLAEWQTKYVNVIYEVYDANCKKLKETDSIINLQGDFGYKLIAKIEPKTKKAATESEPYVAVTMDDEDTGAINVFTPEVTFKDGYVYFGGAMPTSFDSLKTATTWKHGTTVDTDVEMAGDATAPALTFTYTTGKTIVDTNKNIPVNVANANGIPTTFVWDDCNTGETKESGNFQLHVYTPTFDFANGNVYYLGQMPADYNNATLTGWTRNGTALTTAISDKMQNVAPEIGDFDFAYSSSVTGTIKQTGEITVNVTKATVNGASLDLTNNFKLKVYTPEFTFTDYSVYYGAEKPEYTTPIANWNNNDVTMWNKAPRFEMTFEEDDDAVNDAGYVVIPKDYKVNVKALIVKGEDGAKDVDYIKDANITFKWNHGDCDLTPIADHAANADSHELYVHVNTCSITISKDGFDSLKSNEVAMFNVVGDNVHVPVNLDVVVHNKDSVTINGLPVGTYTVDEDEHWSWRYENLTAQKPEVSVKNPTAEISFTNVRSQK